MDYIKTFKYIAQCGPFPAQSMWTSAVGDEWCYLVDIAKVKFMEAQGTLIQYLSVPCNILLMVLNSGLQEVTKVPLSCFLQTATTSWKSMRGCWTVGVLASWLAVASGAGGLVWQLERRVRESPWWDTAWHRSSFSRLSLVWNASPRR